MYPILLKIGILYHMNTTFRNIIFQISVNMPLNLNLKKTQSIIFNKQGNTIKNESFIIGEKKLKLQANIPTQVLHLYHQGKKYAGIEKRRNFSLVARYSLKLSSCSLLVVKSLVTRCRSCSLQKITSYQLQNSLVTRWRSCSLQKITRYSLQKLLIAKNHSLLVGKFARFFNFMKK